VVDRDISRYQQEPALYTKRIQNSGGLRLRGPRYSPGLRTDRVCSGTYQSISNSSSSHEVHNTYSLPHPSPNPTNVHQHPPAEPYDLNCSGIPVLRSDKVDPRPCIMSHHPLGLEANE